MTITSGPDAVGQQVRWRRSLIIPWSEFTGVRAARPKNCARISMPPGRAGPHSDRRAGVDSESERLRQLWRGCIPAAHRSGAEARSLGRAAVHEKIMAVSGIHLQLFKDSRPRACGIGHAGDRYGCSCGRSTCRGWNSAGSASGEVPFRERRQSVARRSSPRRLRLRLPRGYLRRIVPGSRSSLYLRPSRSRRQ